jgi:hypothetical protein
MREKTFNIRVYEEELDQWRAEAAKVAMPLSQWIRERCNNGNYPTEVLRGTRAVRVGRRRAIAEPMVAGGAIHGKDSRNITGKTGKVIPTCKHGIEKGYNCWQCGGMAVIES